MTDERCIYGTPEHWKKGSPVPYMNGAVLTLRRESFVCKGAAFTLGFVAGVAALGAAACFCRDQTTYSGEDDEDEQTDTAVEATPDNKKEKVDTSQTEANASAETDAADVPV